MHFMKFSQLTVLGIFGLIAVTTVKLKLNLPQHGQS